MNKEVIYIEPEQDITDILSNIKAAEHKIVALVPPKKAGVLRSAVNFKLIAKTARQNSKTVVLITTDEALHRLAFAVKMPVAKSLQSKPQLPKLDEEKEAEESAKDVIEEKVEPKAAAVAGAAGAAVAGKKAAEAAAETPVLAKKAPVEEVIEGKPEPDAEAEGKDPKTAKAVAKLKNTKIPNFAKYRKFIVAGIAGLVVLIVFIVWATVIAPAAKIAISVRTATMNFTEKVSFVTHEDKAKAEDGVLYLEEKTITKKINGEFKATGELNKGEKAKGAVTVERPDGETINADNKDYSIPKGTVFTIGGHAYETTEGVTIVLKEGDYKCGLFGCHITGGNKSTGSIGVIAKEAGAKYNIESNEVAVTSNAVPNNYKIYLTTAPTGGTDKVVKVVTKEDVENAASDLGADALSEAREELASEFGENYVMLGDMTQGEAKITSSPKVGEEVGEGTTPVVTREVQYTMHAVNRDPVKTFIESSLKNKLGDDTQQIYDTGVKDAFFESFQNAKDSSTAKLKSVAKTGPRVTEQMVSEKSLGKKIGEVQSMLKSINGVADVKIDTSYFWVTSIPGDPNKVQIEITVE